MAEVELNSKDRSEQRKAAKTARRWLRQVLKWTGIIVGVLAVVLALVVAGLYIAGGARLNQTRTVQAEAITIPTDAQRIKRGEHLVHVACMSCHTEKLSGQVLIADPMIGTVYTANISGIASTHSDADLVRAIRHGVSKDGRQLMIMPSEIFVHFSAEDLGSVIAYLKTVPRSGEARPKPELALMGRILVATGQMKVFPAETIDHQQPFPPMPEVGANVEYGSYLAAFCTTCHGADLNGMQPPDPSSPYAPTLKAAGAWPEEQFIRVIRTGITPAGHQLDERNMPWKSFAKFDDEELRGLWMYLHSLAQGANQ